MTTALTRRPGPELERCELSFLERAPIDFERALEQHGAYVALLRELGVEVQVLEPLAGHPDAVFVEDTAVVLEEVAVLARPGAPSRRGEVAAIEPHLARSRALETIEAPHTLDGGDVVRVGDVLLVGLSQRTVHGGMKALAHAVLPWGQRVKAVEVGGCLHFKSACTHLGDETLLVNTDWFDRDRLAGYDMVPVHPGEPYAANALRVGETVVLSASYPRTAERVAARGFEVRLVDLSELHKAEGAVTCLSLLL